jgi:hypothetical protein
MAHSSKPKAQGSTAQVTQTNSVQPVRRQFVPHRPTWVHRVGAWAIYLVDHALTATLRSQELDRWKNLFDPSKPPKPVIFCIWHNRLALAMWSYRRHPRKAHPRRRMAALVSASRDGAFLAAVLERFGVQPVRGSSSRRGPQALLELVTWAEQDYDLAITPDGPRGPRYVVQPGVISVAQLTGLPILPVSFWLRRKWMVNSWDRFQIPQPFTGCKICVGEVMRVPREASDSEREALRAELELRMRALGPD